MKHEFSGCAPLVTALCQRVLLLGSRVFSHLAWAGPDICGARARGYGQVPRLRTRVPTPAPGAQCPRQECEPLPHPERTWPTGLWRLSRPPCYFQRQVTSLDPLVLRKPLGLPGFLPVVLTPSRAEGSQAPQQMTEVVASLPSLGQGGYSEPGKRTKSSGSLPATPGE